MPSAPLLDDATVDAILDGDCVPCGVDHLASFAAGVRALGVRPPPRPSPELAALLAHGTQAAAPGRSTRATARHRRGRPALATASGLGLAAKVGITTTAAVASLAAAAAAGVLPGDSDAPVRKAIEVFTPVEFTDDGDPLDHGGNGSGADRGDPRDAREHGDDDVPGDDGRKGRDDADEPEADGERGDVDPGAADRAPDAEHSPDDPGEPSNTDADHVGPDVDRQGGPADPTDAEPTEAPAAADHDNG
jgi:hypothetical protein